MTISPKGYLVELVQELLKFRSTGARLHTSLHILEKEWEELGEIVGKRRNRVVECLVVAYLADAKVSKKKK